MLWLVPKKHSEKTLTEVCEFGRILSKGIWGLKGAVGIDP